MAVIEISKIQVRRGQENQTGVPPLDGGEFAWAADTENLYIGLRREDGGSRDANVRILTENDLRNFFAVGGGDLETTVYEYRAESDITTYYTSNTASTRLVLDKLDDIVSIKDFENQWAPLGLNWTEIFQLAINRLFWSGDSGNYATSNSSTYITTSTTLRPVKALYVPAGLYEVNSAIFIPSNTVILGEGIDQTIIRRVTTGSSIISISTGTDVSGNIFQTFDRTHVGNTFDETTEASAMTFLGFSTGTVNFNAPATNIRIEGMTLEFGPTTAVTGTTGLVSLDCAEHTVVRNVKFQGTMYSTSSNKNYVGINIRGYDAVTSNHISIENCEMHNLYSGIKSDFDVHHVKVENCYFTELEKAINLSDPVSSLANIGPRNFSIENNKFYKINKQGLYVGASTSTYISHVVSRNNHYINVGNAIPGVGEANSTGTSVITFLSQGNSSVDDYFERQQYQNVSGGSIEYRKLIEGKSTLDTNYSRTISVPTNTSTSLMRLPITGEISFLQLKYSVINEGTSTVVVDRIGTVNFFISPSPDPTDPTVHINDDYRYGVSDGGIYWAGVVYQEYAMIDILAFNPSSGLGGSGYPAKITIQSKMLL